MQRMQAMELSTYLGNSEPLLIDVREPWEFDICHLGGSINIPMAKIPQHLEKIRGANECVVICHHGVRSMHIIQYLMQQEIGHLINLEGGVDAWAREVDNNMPLY
jgi:rhodanese-related sulfurtransferase